MLKIGLTGGIGCGKSTVAGFFSELNVPIIDADEISHYLAQPGQPTLQIIASIFGAEVLHKNGELNRAYLKKYIFNDFSAKQQLEAILHPLIFQEISNQLTKISADYCIISIPLLFETHAESLVNRILVVNCDTKIQIERVKQRDNLSIEQIQAILKAQVSMEFRKIHAHDIIENSNKKDLVVEHVKKLHNFYLSLSHYQDSLPL